MDQERDMLFGKSYTCPVCGKNFKSLTVRTGKVRSVGSDLDLRPKYEPFDALKYDVVQCTECGYAAMPRNFSMLVAVQKQWIKERFCVNYQPRPESEVFTYQEALQRHQDALMTALAKNGKASERAFVLLRMGWLFRGACEMMEKQGGPALEKAAALRVQEDRYLKGALDGFVEAMQSEDFPICGMDETTTDYLIGALAYRAGDMETASKMVSSIMTSRSASSRVKDRAYDLKELILEKTKQQ